MFASANPTLLEILRVGGKLELPDGSGITTRSGEFGDRLIIWTWSSPLRQEFEVSAAGLEEALRALDHVRYAADGGGIMRKAVVTLDEEQVDQLAEVLHDAWEAVIDYFVYDNLEPDTAAILRESLEKLAVLEIPAIGNEVPLEWTQYQEGFICPHCGERTEDPEVAQATLEDDRCPKCRDLVSENQSAPDSG